jgi:hypothetical protein
VRDAPWVAGGAPGTRCASGARGAADSGAEIALTSYSPTTDPTAPVEVVYRRRDGEPRGVTVEMGPMKLKGRADAHGVRECVEVPAGRITIVSERLWSQGPERR